LYGVIRIEVCLEWCTELLRPKEETAVFTRAIVVATAWLLAAGNEAVRGLSVERGVDTTA
jgi:hypothetical protein